MNEIVKKLIENHRIDEMAYNRSDALRICLDLGREFIEHFHKIYLEGVSSRDFLHHCQEMQTWFNDVSSIKLKSSKKLINDSQLIDWFFTKGSDYDILFSDEGERNLYMRFVEDLLREKKVKESLEKILNGVVR